MLRLPINIVVGILAAANQIFALVSRLKTWKPSDTPDKDCSSMTMNNSDQVSQPFPREDWAK